MKKVVSIILSSSIMLIADSEIELLKNELKKQKMAVETLEKKLDILEKKEYKSELKISDLSKDIKKSSLIPNISLIADGSYVSRNIDNAKYSMLEIPAFTHSHAHDEHGHSHASMHEKEGFNLNYAELSINAPVDPYFELFSTFHIAESSFEIEELYFTSNIYDGVSLKGGKFLSSFGRVNSQHLHYQDFADTPLVYSAILGSHGLLEKGVNLNYTFSAPFYLNAGIELLYGENEQSFGVNSFEVGEFSEKEAKSPNLKVLFIKSSFDLDEQTSLLLGASYATGKSRIDHLEDEENAHAFAGDSDIYGVDLTIKKYFSTHNYLKFQTEYLYRELDGFRYAIIADTAKQTKLAKEQGGYYAEVVYSFDKNHRVGVRYENLDKNRVFVNSKNQNFEDGFDKSSIMYDYSLSEFSKIRFQYDMDKSKYIEGQNVDFNQFIVQFNMLIGSHAAHSF